MNCSKCGDDVIGLDRYCKPCRKSYNVKYQAENREQIQLSKKEYYKYNKKQK